MKKKTQNKTKNHDLVIKHEDNKFEINVLNTF